MATRLEVNINDATAEALRELSTSKDTTVTEIVSRSVSVYDYLKDAQDSGKQIRLVQRRRWWQLWKPAEVYTYVTLVG